MTKFVIIIIYFAKVFDFAYEKRRRLAFQSAR